MSEPVRLAVFPVAGFGTRFLPATKATPKEMLPVVDKPLIQYAVEEAYEAGIRNMIFVTGRNKWAITEHYDIAYELENELEQRGKKEFLQLVRRITPRGRAPPPTRKERAGAPAHAVLCAQPIVRDRPFAILLADDLVINEGKSVIKQMVEVFEKHQQGVLGVMDVPREDTKRYGIITEGAALSEQIVTVDAIVEKPEAAEAPSTLAVIGRYILPGYIMQLLQNTPKGAGGEIQLTDAISALIKERTVLAYRFEGKRYDCGDKLGYLEANVELGLRHPELGEGFREYLRNLEL